MTIHLPTLNASLNATAGLLLFLGWLAIKRGDQKTHRNFMIAAMCCSILFLCSYVYYHSHVGRVAYQGQGILRWIYFFILGTHTPLAILIVPASIAAVWQAFTGNLKTHVKITRVLYPTWVYVSVTGVIIYIMLYIF